MKISEALVDRLQVARMFIFQILDRLAAHQMLKYLHILVKHGKIEYALTLPEAALLLAAVAALLLAVLSVLLLTIAAALLAAKAAALLTAAPEAAKAAKIAKAAKKAAELRASERNDDRKDKKL